MKLLAYQPWPALPYQEFQSTAHLLHMGAQMLGKIILTTPFQPHWANVTLWLTSRGLTTWPIPFKSGTFNIDFDFINHQIIGTSSWEASFQFDIQSMSVAELMKKLFLQLKNM